MASKEFDFKEWFDKEVERLEHDPEYIAYGEETEEQVQELRGCNEIDRASL